MLNRIAANRAAGPTRGGRALRLAGSALAVMTVLGVGGVAKWALADDYDRPPVAVAPPPVSSAPATPASSLASAAATSRPASTSPPRTSAGSTTPTPSTSPVRGHPGDTQVVKGSLSSTSRLVGEGGSEVTVTAGADLTEFEMTVRVLATPGLVAAGGTSSTGGVTVTVSKQAGAFLYHYVLAAGRTMTAGTYTFGARYDGGRGRDSAGDTYDAYATSVEHKRIHIYGNFIPRD
jgi:hypothetical protein